jgi:hypothetical protein
LTVSHRRGDENERFGPLRREDAPFFVRTAQSTASFGGFRPAKRLMIVFSAYLCYDKATKGKQQIIFERSAPAVGAARLIYQNDPNEKE